MWKRDVWRGHSVRRKSTQSTEGSPLWSGRGAEIKGALKVNILGNLSLIYLYADSTTLEVNKYAGKEGRPVAQSHANTDPSPMIG